jgi:hypothetical protein
MKNSFSEVKLFQVKPDKQEEFETLVKTIANEQKKQDGCIDVKYLKRFYVIDEIESGNPPRELTKIVKCVKYFSYWEFDNKENYGKAISWLYNQPTPPQAINLTHKFFRTCYNPVQRQNTGRGYGGKDRITYGGGV